jgi:hypothetical protein
MRRRRWRQGSTEVPQERKAAYYVGMVLIVVGFLLFVSTFVTAAANFGDFTDFHERAKSNMFRALGGMALCVIGGVVRGLGARGLAGSGAVLDPSQARKDLEPYSRQAGGMLKDALDEAGVKLGGAPEKVVMVKCRACGKLNEEDSKFCQECGKPV